MRRLLSHLWRRRRTHRGDWNRRRGRNYEWERATQSLRHLVLFLILSFVLALALKGGWR